MEKRTAGIPNVRLGVLEVLVLCAMSAGAHAQTLSGGAKLGVNLTTIPPYGDRPIDGGIETRWQNGFVAGGFVTARVTERFSFQPELLFTQKGAQLAPEFRPDREGPFDQLRISYLEVPLLGQVSWRGQERVRPYVFGGPAFAFKLNATRERSTSNKEDIDDEINGTDVGVVAGTGIQISSWLVEARLTQGLTEIFQETRNNGGVTVRNRVVTFLGGVRF